MGSSRELHRELSEREIVGSSSQLRVSTYGTTMVLHKEGVYRDGTIDEKVTVISSVTYIRTYIVHTKPRWRLRWDHIVHSTETLPSNQYGIQSLRIPFWVAQSSSPKNKTKNRVNRSPQLQLEIY